MNFSNFFNKPPKTEENPKQSVEQDSVANIEQSSPEVSNLNKPKTIEDVKGALSDLQELKSQRLEKLSELQKKKDEIRSMGVSEFVNSKKPTKRTETFNALVQEDESSLAEISQKIEDIRKKFDINPSDVERLTEYRDRVKRYIDHIDNNMAPEYREVTNLISKYFDENNSLNERWYQNKDDIRSENKIIDFINSVSKYHIVLPEVQEFVEEIKDLKISDPEQRPAILNAIKSFIRKIKESASEKTLYKTPGEIKEAKEKMQRADDLHFEISKRIKDAENKEGDFATQKSN